MYARLRNTFVALLLLAAACGSWLWSRPASEPPAGASVELSTPAAYYLSGARFLGTDETGRVLYSVLAEHAEEFSDQALLLSEVRVEYQPSEEVPWSINATRAKAPKNGRYLDLEGRVELLNGAGGRGTKLETTSLRLEPALFTATSDEAVKVDVGGWLLHAVGVTADLKGDTLTLASEVHGQILP